MDTVTLTRFRDSFERQRDNLLNWLSGTSFEKRQINLGTSAEPGVQARLETLNTAIAQTDAKTFGLCDVCHEDVNTELLEMDYRACVCIDHFTDEQKRRLEQDLELSHKVQKALLPKEVPVIPGMKLAAFIQPAEIVGGDYFDFFRFRDGAHGIAIADVMGKGLPASMLVASLQASLRILVPENNSPADVIKRLNTLFCHNIQLIKFISIVLARYEPESSMLEYCNAGHNPPIHLHGLNGNASSGLMPTGPAIGLTETADYSAKLIRLQESDAVVFYTDGATEARNPSAEEFGEGRLKEWIVANGALDPKSLIDGLRTALHGFTGTKSFHDDLTFVAAKRME